MTENLFHKKGQSLFLSIKVHPQGGRNSISLTKTGELKVTITAAPEGGAANQAVIKALSDWLDIKKSAIDIVQGQSSRKKVVSLPLDVEDILQTRINQFIRSKQEN